MWISRTTPNQEFNLHNLPLNLPSNHRILQPVNLNPQPTPLHPPNAQRFPVSQPPYPPRNRPGNLPQPRRVNHLRIPNLSWNLPRFPSMNPLKPLMNLSLNRPPPASAELPRTFAQCSSHSINPQARRRFPLRNRLVIPSQRHLPYPVRGKRPGTYWTWRRTWTILCRRY